MKYKKRYGISKDNWIDVAQNTRYCTYCGHSILFQMQTKRVICKWCGHWVYNKNNEEFKDKLLQKKMRLENES